MSLLKIIAWNCRGIGSSNALRHILLLLRSNNPDILILEETRVGSQYVERIIAKTNFTEKIVVEANRYSGEFGFYGTMLI